MLIRHKFGIAVPLIFTPRKDIRAEIEKLRREKVKESSEPNF